MKFVIAIITFFMYGVDISAQESISKAALDRIEDLLLHREIETADSLLQQAQLRLSGISSSYQENYIIGLLFYYQEKYEESASMMNAAITKMDSLHLWDCENYLKTAYYIADSYIHLNKKKESEAVINFALIKCISSYKTCVYAKKMYQLLLALYKEFGHSSAVIEQVHNEIQKIAINIYASNNTNTEGEQIKEKFMFFYNYIINPTISQEDSLYMNQGKAAYLYIIGEYEESIRLYEKVKTKLSKYDQQLRGINESLLNMYSYTGHIDAIENLLPEMYDYSSRMNLDYDPYSLNVWVGYNLNQSGYFDAAQSYYEACNSFLNLNNVLLHWIEKKKNVLAKMVFNCRSLGAYEKVICYCKEYAKYTNETIYEEHFFVNYNQAYAYSSMGNYDQAIAILRKLRTYIQLNGSINSLDYIMINYILGVCYVKTNRNNEAIECTSKAIDIYKKTKLDDKHLLGFLYNYIGKAYLQKRLYEKALPLLNLSAEIQIELTGVVSPNTQSYIDRCKKQE